MACFNPEGECWRYTYDAFGRRLSKSKVVDNRPTPPLSSPFKDTPFTSAKDVGANGQGSYIEYEVHKDTLVQTYLGSNRATAIIPSEPPYL
ncbi:hypothetical protein LW139_15480 [Proteus vulgaris]|nr:hypothetical protein [Proteus vulgaris]UPK83236.1 hypothetical protein LW139_15480 [Proteus vulgaris]